MKQNRSALGRFALTHIAVAALGLASTAAFGLGLGRLSVQSALGETLKAEIDVSSLTPEEAGTLKVRIAPPESYRATGVEYNAVLTSTQVQLVRRNDGRQVLRISSERAIQEPFVDVILELSWASGRLVREYTLLFDPPSLARPTAPEVTSTPVASAAPEASPVAAPRTPASTPLASAPVAPPATRPRAEAPTPAPAPRPAPAPAPASSTAASEYTVRPGDTLSRVASRTKPSGISLDQMLVGLFRSNPDAFVGDNMNRLKSGVVLQVPGSDSLGAISAGEARQVIQAQSADFSGYRQRLAGAAPELRQDESQRQAKGQVQAAVEDRKPAAAPSPDKLTLSKGGKAAAAAASEAKLSKDTEKKADAARVAELTRNVEELKKLSSAAKPEAAPAPSAAPAPASAPQPAVTVAAAPQPVPASAPAESPKPAVQASAPKPAPKPLPAPTPAPEEPGLLDNPLVLPVAGVLVALLGGLGFMRMRGKLGGKPKADTGFHESRLQPDSFFGATGGQRVDTRDASGAASSMSYSLSQLDAIGDVDPVAEADVYLAYGRDLQAEEILKEALRANPDRLAIRLKLLEVYAKRRDTKGFEQLAIQLYAETNGQGEDWAKAQELGRQVDADNPLYQPGGSPNLLQGGEEEVRPEPMNASTLPQTAQHGAPVAGNAHLATEPLGRSALSDAGPPSGLDLDLDLDLAAPPAAAPAVSPFAMDATQAMATTVEQAPLAMDFDLDAPPSDLGAAAVPAPHPDQVADLEFDLGDLGQPEESTQAAALQVETGGEAPQALDFDLSSISLDLPEPEVPAIPTAVAEPLDQGLPAEFEGMLQDEGGHDPLAQAFDALEDDGGDPLQRQLELADEFRQIGDTEGARDVLQELLAKASGPLRDKAQSMLKELG